MSAPSSVWSQFFLGARAFLPIVLSIAAYGMVWGVGAGQAGMTPLEVLLMSGLLYAGSSQFVAVTMWTPGALPIGTLIIAAAVVNLRLLLMTATLRPLFANTPRWRAALAMFLVGDEQWAFAMSEMSKGRGSVPFFMGTAVLSWFVWVAATLAGRLLGAVIDDPATYGLDFAFTAVFLALLFGMWKGKADLIPWLSGAAIAILVARFIPGMWYVIAGGLGGSLIGALVQAGRPADVA